MRVTIVPDDKAVTVNGEGYSNLDLSFIDADIHAVQWYGTHGEIERKDLATGKMTSNEEISSFDQFQQAVTAWQTEKDRIASELILRLNQNVSTENVSNVSVESSNT